MNPRIEGVIKCAVVAGGILLPACDVLPTELVSQPDVIISGTRIYLTLSLKQTLGADIGIVTGALGDLGDFISGCPAITVHNDTTPVRNLSGNISQRVSVGSPGYIGLNIPLITSAFPDQKAKVTRYAIYHEAGHACTQAEPHPPIEFDAKPRFIPSYGFRYQDLKTNTQETAFDEAYSEVVAYYAGASSKEDLSDFNADPLYGRLKYLMLLTVARDRKEALDLKQLHIKNDLAGFAAKVRGIPKDKLNEADYDQVKEWYLEALQSPYPDPKNDPFLKELASEILRLQGKPLPPGYPKKISSGEKNALDQMLSLEAWFRWGWPEKGGLEAVSGIIGQTMDYFRFRLDYFLIEKEKSAGGADRSADKEIQNGIKYTRLMLSELERMDKETTLLTRNLEFPQPIPAPIKSA